MVNKNYIRGRNREYMVIKILKKEGYIAQRSAGSHGVDVIAWMNNKLWCFDYKNMQPETPIYKFIMVASKFSKKKFQDDKKKLESVPTVLSSRECWFYDKTKKNNFDIRVLENEV